MIRINRIFLTLSLLVCLSYTPLANAQAITGSAIITKAVQARIDSTLKVLVSTGHTVGISALVFEKGKEVYYNAFGFADREASVPMDRNTLVRIFSMTKPITGTALMQLYEKELFQLDDPLSKYLPEFTNMMVFDGIDASGKLKLVPAKRPITLRDLTRHTAGFASAEHPVLGTLYTQADAMNKNNTLAQMTQKLAALPLAFQPGEQWAYGVSVDVQARLVEQLSGKPFDVYVKENVLIPLGMNDTRYVPNDIKRLAALYRKGKDGTFVRVADEEANAFNGKPWPLRPGGFGLTSQLDDYMHFAQMLVNDGTFNGTRILKNETVKLMATNQLSDDVTERMWLPSKGQVGFGIDFAVRLRPPVDAQENNGVVGEFFWDGAASTLFWIDPANKLTAVLFVQVLPYDGNIHKQFRDAVYGKFTK